MTDRESRSGVGATVLALAACLAVAAVRPAAGTALEIEVVGPVGSPVEIAAAEVLLVAWGGTVRVPLAPEGTGVSLPMDEEWLARAWPDGFELLEKAYLYLEAEGLAPVRSEPFQWLGYRQAHQGRERTATEVAFPGGERAELAEGETAAITVALRRPVERHLRLVDPSGAPVPGVEVSSFLFWSRSNDCDQLVESHPLGVAVTDAEGRVPVPDGDHEVAFVFDKDPWVVDDPRGLEALPERAILTFDEPEETVRLRELRRLPLSARLIQEDRAIAGWAVQGCVARCPCGACCTEIGRTDAEGFLRLEEFYPERWEKLFVEDRSETEIWRADPTGWLETGAPEVIELERF